MSEHQKQLDRTKLELMTHKDMAFITTVCFSMKHEWDDTISTACTNGVFIKYNPQFWLDLDPDEQLFLILHETWHVAFAHMGRLQGRNMRAWNVAADYVINFMLVSLGYKIHPNWLYDAQYAGMSTEQVYELIKGEPDENLPMDDLIPNGDTEEEQEDAQSKIDDILVRASLQSQMSDEDQGVLPGEIQLYINGLLKPKIHWTRLLARFVTRAVKRKRSYTKPNRRFFPKVFIPTRYSLSLSDIAIAGDISGSVSDDTFCQYLSEAYQVLAKEKPTSVTFMQFDTTIKQIDVLTTAKSLMDVTLHGRGGTKIEPVIQWAAENKPTVMIILTDGRFRINAPDPKVPIIWAISDNPGFKPPFGQVIHLKT